jgi:hypothetical protein
VIDGPANDDPVPPPLRSKNIRAPANPFHGGTIDSHALRWAGPDDEGRRVFLN